MIEQLKPRDPEWPRIKVLLTKVAPGGKILRLVLTNQIGNQKSRPAQILQQRKKITRKQKREASVGVEVCDSIGSKSAADAQNDSLREVKV